MPDFQTIEGEVVKTTDRALLVYFASADQAIWVPRSNTEGGDVLEEGDTDPSIATWWLRLQGLEEE